MFIWIGQLFSQGATARSWHTPARHLLTRIWSSNSSRKWRSDVSTELGADWPRPQSERVADHAPELIELGQILFPTFALGDAG